MRKSISIKAALSQLLTNSLSSKSNNPRVEFGRLPALTLKNGRMTLKLDLFNGLPSAKSGKTVSKTLKYKNFTFHLSVAQSGKWFKDPNSGFVLYCNAWVNGPRCNYCDATSDRFRNIKEVTFFSEKKKLECKSCKKLHERINMDDMADTVAKEIVVLSKQAFGLT